MDTIARVIFGAIMLAGIAVLVKGLPPLPEDPADGTLARALLNAKEAFGEFGSTLADYLENETPIGRIVAWLERKTGL